MSGQNRPQHSRIVTVSSGSIVRDDVHGFCKVTHGKNGFGKNGKIFRNVGIIKNIFDKPEKKRALPAKKRLPGIFEHFSFEFVSSQVVPEFKHLTCGNCLSSLDDIMGYCEHVAGLKSSPFPVFKANPPFGFVNPFPICDIHPMLRFASLALFLAFACVATAASPIIREPGAVYLSDFNVKPLKLKVLEPAPAYFDTAQTRYAGTLRFPQIVQVEALDSNGLLRIRGNAQQGGIAAWVNPQFLEPLPPAFAGNLRKSEERRIQVEALISRNEVALGMTPDEVSRSLGKPQKKTNRADNSGTQQVWEYIKYQLVPQTTYAPVNNQTVVTYPPGTNSPGGTLIQNSSGYGASTIYVKVPVGKLTVTFKDNIVESLDQSEGTTTGGQVSVVIPPLNVYW